ncbi:hypothetical protein ACWCSD_50775, partial [Nonomuraea sp. NPDC001684]
AAYRVLMGMALTGPASALVHTATSIIYSPDGDLYTYATDQYGPLTYHWRFWIRPDYPLIQLRVDAVVDVTEPGTISLAPTVAREQWSYPNGPANWSSNGGDLEYVDTPAHSEPGAARLAAWGDQETAAIVLANTFSGGGYRFSAWLYSPAGWPSVGVWITWWDGDGMQVAEAELLEAIPAGEWKHYLIEDEAPVSAERVEVFIGMRQSPPAGTELYVDDVVLEQTTGQLQVLAGSLLAVAPM